MERKEEQNSPDIFWSREPITGHRGTKENPAIVPSYNDSRVVGLETESVSALDPSHGSIAHGLFPIQPLLHSPAVSLICTDARLRRFVNPLH